MKRKDTEMKTTIAALILAAAVASPAMAQEVIESSLPTQVAASYGTFNAAGSQAYASTRPAASHRTVQQRWYSNVDPYANAPSQNQNDIIDR
jgi:hypothetical protein